MNKYETELQLAEAAARLCRQLGQPVVFTNGCFDLIHLGHIRLLYQAAEYGDLLLVAVNSDASVRTLKGPNRPINQEEARKQVVAAIRPVSYAFVFDALDTAAVLERLRPDYVVKSGEWAQGLKPVEQAVCDQHGIIVVFLEPLPGYSTTKLLERS